MALFATLALLMPVAPGLLAHHNVEPAEEHSSFAGRMIATRLTTPERFAILIHKPENHRTLHKVGDLLFHPEDHVHHFLVDGLTANLLVLLDSSTGERIATQPGQHIPGSTTVVFGGTVMLDRLEYRLKPVGTVQHDEPIVIEIAGGRAVLEQEARSDTTGAPEPVVKHGPDPGPERRGRPSRPLPVREVARDVYEVPEAVVRPVVAKAGEVLAGIRPKFTPMYMVRPGTAREFTSKLGDVTLTGQGFEVTRPGIARTFGIEVGDRVVSLNGRPVTSPLNAWWTYQELFVRDRRLNEVRVDIARNGRVITKTFRIR